MHTTVIIGDKIKRKNKRIAIRNYDTVIAFDAGMVQVIDKGTVIFEGTFEDAACLFIQNRNK